MRTNVNNLIDEVYFDLHQVCREKAYLRHHIKNLEKGLNIPEKGRNQLKHLRLRQFAAVAGYVPSMAASLVVGPVAGAAGYIIGSPIHTLAVAAECTTYVATRGKKPVMFSVPFDGTSFVLAFPTLLALTMFMMSKGTDVKGSLIATAALAGIFGGSAGLIAGPALTHGAYWDRVMPYGFSRKKIEKAIKHAEKNMEQWEAAIPHLKEDFEALDKEVKKHGLALRVMQKPEYQESMEAVLA